ncbi:MAG: glycosyltransferase family 39 protein, partial [Candidatus Aenigmatarchaeota archaeon]
MEIIKKILIFLFLIGFFIRLSPIRSDSSFHYWDESIYLQHAEILGGYREDNYNEFDFRPPLLPVLIMLGYKIYHSVITAHFIVAFIASLGIISTFFLTKSFLKNEKIALFAAIIFAFNPLHIVLSHSILVDSMLPTFWSFTILFLILAIQKNKAFLFFVSGFFLGLSILLKFTSILLALCIISTLFLYKKFNKKLILKI